MAHLPARIPLTRRLPPQRKAIPRLIVTMMTLAALFYLAMLHHMSAEGPEKDTLIFIFAGLWIDLAAMCVIADRTMRTPRWSPMLSVLLLPLAGVAVFAAIAIAGRTPLAFSVPIALPPLIALAAVSPWLSQWHARLSVSRMLALCWGAVLALSLLTVLNAA